MLQLATGAVELAGDANTAARVGKRGGFAEEAPREALGLQPTHSAVGGSAIGDATGTTDDDIAHLIARFDALVALENESVRKSEEVSG